MFVRMSVDCTYLEPHPNEPLPALHRHLQPSAEIRIGHFAVDVEVVVRGADAEIARDAVLEADGGAGGAAGVDVDLHVREGGGGGFAGHAVGERDARLHSGESD